MEFLTPQHLSPVFYNELVMNTLNTPLKRNSSPLQLDFLRKGRNLFGIVMVDKHDVGYKIALVYRKQVKTQGKFVEISLFFFGKEVGSNVLIPL